MSEPHPAPQVATRSRRGGRFALALAALVAGGAACSRAPAPEPSVEGTAMADVAVVAVEDETSFLDLPGVERFELLTPTLQAAVLERANHARCDCGCPGHSVNACLHQQELCDVALGLARGFVADAEVLALTAPEAAGEPAPAASPAATSASEASPGDAADPGLAPGDAADPQPAPDGASPAPEETGVPPSQGDSAPGASAADER